MLSITTTSSSTSKRLPAMRETHVQSLDREDPLEKEMATHFSILAWRVPWTEEPGGLQSMGLQRVGQDWATSLHFTSLLLVQVLYYLGNYLLEFELKVILFFFLSSTASFKEHPSSSELYFKEALKNVLISMLILPLLWNSKFMIQKIHMLGCSWLGGQQCIPWDV